MQVDGNAIKQQIGENIANQIKRGDTSPRLDLFYVGQNSIIETFIRLKKEFGEKVGAEVVVHAFTADTSRQDIIDSIEEAALSEVVNGVVVQLPVPTEFGWQSLADKIPPQKDVDVLATASRNRHARGNSLVPPPVVGAVAEIMNRHNIDLKEAQVAVVGEGGLVGQPAITWLENNFSPPEVFVEGDNLSRLQSFDVVISGAGDPHIIQPRHVAGGSVLIDAGTSHAEGGMKGDMHPDCASKARLFSPVPGGVGPITVAKLFENLLTLMNTRQTK